ncbi:gamma-glutamylcyclotransferase family protein [Vibrio gallicus]|uniref:gamma-glutamylcyclotransferase family protein n=1 Tax=Vibrio gallicus TaxID=190897 RepID=UPI0021C26DBD|nr:gamma-glutamylcyclotransferase [Vibrio gallicus]
MQYLVFVYGTLRQGESNHHLLEASELLGMFETKPEYALFDLGAYPGLVEGYSAITGEIYRIDEKVLEQLDILEDVPTEYRREVLETPFGEAWIYLYQGSENGKAIESGDWNLRN